MKYPYTTKNWKSVKRDLEKTLQDNVWKPTVYFCKSGYIAEVSFVEKHRKGESYGGFSYQDGSCSQPLMKRIAAMIPKKYWEKL